MKKLLIKILIGTLVLTSIANASDVTERQDIQIVVNGVVAENLNTPIIVNSRTLLPLRDLVTTLGVPNDEEHIIWDNELRKVFINNNDTHIELTIDSDVALLNDEEQTLDAPAIIYNDFTYIPARFVGEALNKKIGWDIYDSKVLVRDNEMFEEVKNVFSNVENAETEVNTLKATAFIDLGYQSSGDVMNVITYMELNLPRKELYTVGEAKYLDLISSTEQYFKDGKHYAPNEFGAWEEQPAEQDFATLQGYAKSLADVTINDQTLYDIFTIDTEKTNDEIVVLRSDINYKGLLKEITDTAQAVTNSDFTNEIKELNFEYEINRTTWKVDKLTAILVTEDKEANDDMYIKIVIEINELNTEFEVYNPLV